MTTSIEEIYEFVALEVGIEKCNIEPHSDLEIELGIAGDDFSDLMSFFAEKFNVKMDAYLWYFHHAEEGLFNLGGLIFKPPNQRVLRIPVTPALLEKAANLGYWPVEYPQHNLPNHRYDLLLNKVFILFFVLVSGIAWLWNKRSA
ncbi:DUF1493 family protein [Undibacterium flavidum]|uniref:DUF1493 family protein n=1 Tax=Undibacterium flavidum TaxID=2762297 RepID=A0ABR6YBN2_9BURK|nr:DUF1493 family protein [Undibacterium flavidum]MBC3874047.1 DUF1493 family protein [Undibacterium flavidum]